MFSLLEILFKGCIKLTQSLRELKVAKTKKLIRDTLVDLIEEKGFDAITISDITVNAGLNRGTFYLHFRDKYDLMEKSQNEILIGLQEKFISVKPYEFDKYYSKDMIYPPILQVFHYLMENSRFIKILLSSKGDPGFPKKMKEFIRVALYEKLVEVIENNSINTIPKEYTTAFISSAFFGVIEEWLEKDVPHSPEEMAMVHMKVMKFLKQFVTQIVK